MIFFGIFVTFLFLFGSVKCLFHVLSDMEQKKVGFIKTVHDNFLDIFVAVIFFGTGLAAGIILIVVNLPK